MDLCKTIVLFFLYGINICNSFPSLNTTNSLNLPSKLTTKTLSYKSFTDMKNLTNIGGINSINSDLTPCTCAVFLTGQFTKGSTDQPTGQPALLHEQDVSYPCTTVGNKQCTNKCLETIVKHLPNSPAILCGTIDRDCHKERAYLFIQNCKPLWINTNLSAGREYCCKDGLSYKCPLIN